MGECQKLETFMDLLACPYCHGFLQFTVERAFCGNCNISYPVSNGRFDFRLQKPKKAFAVYTLGQSCKLDVKLEKFDAKITDLFPKPAGKAVMLDLGCGEAPHKQACMEKGYRYVGIDCDSVKATFLGDAHSLPFRNESFDLILSTALIEHLRYPLVAMHEAYRVLKPNRVFIGSAAFQEPFHGNSYMHHTHLGLTDLFQNAGFTIELLGANTRWNMLAAHAYMSLFPGMPYTLTRILVAPLNRLHRLWWKIGSRIKPDKLSEERRLAWTSGAFLFKLRKPKLAKGFQGDRSIQIDTNQ